MGRAFEFKGLRAATIWNFPLLHHFLYDLAMLSLERRTRNRLYLLGVLGIDENQTGYF